MSTLIFILSIFFIVYVYAGYPLIIYLLNRNKTKLYPDKEYNCDVSIIMVVCNERKYIENKINNLLALECNGKHKDIIIVDDCSDDNTCDLIEKYTSEVILIRNDKRKGKASGINTAMSRVNTELVLLVDCRQELDKDVLVHLSSWFASDSAIGAVSGELMFKSKDGNKFSEGMDGYWKYEKFIRKNEATLLSVPGVTGALYMLKTCTFENIPEDTLLDDVQIPMVCATKGYRVVYDDRALAWDVPSTSMAKEKRRKIRTLSGNYQMLFRYPAWIIPGGHPIWWQYFSHKIARLFCPFMAIISLFAALDMYSTYPVLIQSYLCLVISVIILVPLSIIFPVINNNKFLKMVSAFIILNWFCLLAFINYITSNQSGSWKK